MALNEDGYKQRLWFKLKDGREVSGEYDSMGLAIRLAGYWNNEWIQSKVESIRVIPVKENP